MLLDEQKILQADAEDLEEIAHQYGMRQRKRYCKLYALWSEIDRRA